MSIDCFYEFRLPFCEENQKKFLLFALKIVPVTVLRKLVLAFHVTLKVITQAACDP